jgi:uncharacterized protein YidB (DUF937 family)
MGLVDVLNGMRNGPRGAQSGSGSSGGMSPITMAILALLAYKGIKHLGGSQQQQPAPGANPGRVPGGSPMGADARADQGGGLGDLLKGGLGGLLAGGTAGSILSGGLGDLLKQFQQSGQGETAKSWVSRGPNQDISENDLARSIGSEDLDALSRHTGMSRNELLSGLRRELPGAVDELTPEGRVPTPDEASRWV